MYSEVEQLADGQFYFILVLFGFTLLSPSEIIGLLVRFSD